MIQQRLPDYTALSPEYKDSVFCCQYFKAGCRMHLLALPKRIDP